jgi:hypothetical protein
MIYKECTWGSNYSARFPAAPCSLGAFPLAILLRPPATINPFLSRVLPVNQSIDCSWNTIGKWCLCCVPVLFIAVIETSVLCWQFMFYVPWSSADCVVLHKIYFCFHGNGILFLVSFFFLFPFPCCRRMVGPQLGEPICRGPIPILLIHGSHRLST